MSCGAQVDAVESSLNQVILARAERNRRRDRRLQPALGAVLKLRKIDRLEKVVAECFVV